MNYKELNNIEAAFYEFLRKLKSKKVIKVLYYDYHGTRGKIDFAFIGYETLNKGAHGIHYNGQRHAYSFGTREIESKSWITGLTGQQEKSIPEYLKEALKDVADRKKDKIVKK